MWCFKCLFLRGKIITGGPAIGEVQNEYIFIFGQYIQKLWGNIYNEQFSATGIDVEFKGDDTCSRWETQKFSVSRRAI